MRSTARNLYVALAVTLCLAALAGIVVLLAADDSTDIASKLAFTAVALLVFGLTAAAGLSLAGAPLAWIGWACVLVSITGLGLDVFLLWDIDEEDVSEDLLKTAGSVTLFALALAHVCLTLARVRSGDDRIVRSAVGATMLFVLGLAALLTVAIVGEITDELYLRLTAAVGVLAALGTAMIPVLRALRHEHALPGED